MPCIFIFYEEVIIINDNTREFVCKLEYRRKRYKVKLYDIYEFQNVIDCYVKFTNNQVQRNFMNFYLANNNYNLTESKDFAKICFINDIECICYFYIVEKENKKIVKAHIRKCGLHNS